LIHFQFQITQVIVHIILIIDRFNYYVFSHICIEESSNILAHGYFSFLYLCNEAALEYFRVDADIDSPGRVFC